MTNKKRKEPPLNCTLLDFFSSPSATKRSKVRTLPPPSIRSSKVASRDILVIDSDSDGDIPRRDKGVSEDLSLNTQDTVTFGVPSALLRPPNRCHGGHADQQPPIYSPKATQSESMTSVATKKTCLVMHENMPICSGNGPPVGEFSFGDWAAGDDEIVPPDPSNSTETAEGDDQPRDDQLSCPVCGMHLICAPEAEFHVNQCLDTVSLQSESGSLATTALRPEMRTEGHTKADLYTVLMSSHKVDEIWVEADAAASAGRDLPGLNHGSRRKAPFYKVLQGMPIAVDAFCYGAIPGVTAYFLTHAHSDHYTTLGSKWKNGPIYCSEETANLVLHMLDVNPRWIHPLPMDTPTMIPNTGGVSVTLIDANHCPGSCILFFEGQQTVDAGDSSFKSPHVGSSRIFRYLHCGDFRASPRHVLHPVVNGRHLDHVYLDTTYLDPKYTFPPQLLVISACADLSRRLVMGSGICDEPDANTSRSVTIDTWMKPPASAKRDEQRASQERILVVVGTYSVGKERIIKAIAHALETKIYCEPRKAAILRCQADEELHTLLTHDPTEANVHMMPLGAITSDNLKLYLQSLKGTFSRIIGLRPTGWTFSPPAGNNFNGSIQSIVSRGQSRYFTHKDLQPTQKSSYNIQIYGVPYSEHSSFFELTCFAMSCDWGRMIPTVNVGNPASRAKMTKWLRRWELEKRRSKSIAIQPRTSDYW